MNQIFQMRFYGALQTKGLQSYEPLKFTKAKDGPNASLDHSDLAKRDQAILIIFDCKLGRHITLL